MQKVIEYSALLKSDLYVDAIYKGGKNKNASDDPINKLVKCGNQGGFRYLGNSSDLSKCKLIVLYTSGEDMDWPDFIDMETGSFSYFGDNKKPGHQLHDTPRKGNLLLKNIFDALHANQLHLIPPIFIFSKGPEGRDVIFKGLCVPGFHGYSQTEDLVAIWKIKGKDRFQNYKAIFTILDIPSVSKLWIDDILLGKTHVSKYCPVEYMSWVRTGNSKVLVAQRSKEYRTREEQTPKAEDLKLLEVVYKHYSKNPHGFEKCAAEIALLMDKNFASYDLTRPWQDGGRDAVGKYKIGNELTSIKVDFALEAKCYSISNAVGVKETSRLISRLRHRQFGILVTTSYVHIQAYKELIDDGHPVIIISGADIVNVLKRAGIRNESEVQAWLNGIEVKLRYKIDEPANFSDSEIKTFVTLLKKQGQIENPTDAKVKASSFLCILYKNEVPVGIGAIKQVYKTPFDKAGKSGLKPQYNFELGYIFLDPESNLRGLGIGKNIAKQLLERVDRKNVFATTEYSDQNKMLRILKELGFVPIGNVYKGANTGKEIALLLRNTSSIDGGTS